MSVVISIENISKSYRLGQIGTGTFTHDLNAWWARMRGKPNPSLRIGERDFDKREMLSALRGVNLDVQKGEVLGIIGHNGAGKSTLLKILSRVTAPTSGRIRIKGRVSSLLEVGTGFHPDLTGGENIYLNGAILGMNKAEIRNKFDEIVDFAEIERFVDTPVKRYSSGMFVKLAFAVAAHLESEIVLLDEVLAVGDMAFQEKCIGKMRDVTNQGRTVLFVSHNMGAVISLCRNAILMRDGVKVFQGATLDVISHYRTEHNAGTLEFYWPNQETAPGNNNARLHHVVIHPGNNKVRPLTTSDSICISIGFWNLSDAKVVWAGLNLLDSTGGLIMSCINLPSSAMGDDAFRGIPLSKGLYESTIRLPNNFLNDQVYGVIPYIQTSLMTVDAAPPLPLYFLVNDSGDMRKEYTAPWQGMLRPKLNWTTVKIKHHE